MNAPLHPTLHKPPLTVDAAYALIGQLIVRCAKLEAGLTQLLLFADRGSSAKLPISQKIRAIRTALVDDGEKAFVERHQRRVSIILLEAERILALRAECAHSMVTIAIVGGTPSFLLRNAQLTGEPLNRCVVVTEAELISAGRRAVQLANQLHQLTSLTLPPQPKPAATAGP